MYRYSTREVANKLGIHLVTLQGYIAAARIPAPPVRQVGGVQVRLWTDADVKRAQTRLLRTANGRKTRWQKLRATQKKAKKKG